MSNDLWKPDGNMAQTEIDCQIERYRYLRKKAQGELSDLLIELDLTRRGIKEIEDHLYLLRDSISIVSMKEYALLKAKSRALSISVRLIGVDVSALETYIQNCNDKISALQIEKEKLASKILEFKKDGKRAGPKARKR